MENNRIGWAEMQQEEQQKKEQDEMYLRVARMIAILIIGCLGSLMLFLL
jgi:hypothetical protein